MSDYDHVKCPECGRFLVGFNGHVGRCVVHHWISPVPMYEAEALEMNRREMEEMSMRSDYEMRQAMSAPRAAKRSRLPRVVMTLLLLVTAAAAVLVILKTRGII